MDITQLVTPAGQPSRPGIVAGYVSTLQPAPAVVTDPVYVIVPNHSFDRPYGPLEWPQLHGSMMPAKGSPVTIAFDDNNTPVIVAWSPPSGVVTVPAFLPGMLMDFAGAAAPDGWLLANGASLLRANYQPLYNAIGITYGAADGTHFTLPDHRGRVAVGVGTGAGLTARALAVASGSETLVKAEIPVHNHGGATSVTGNSGTESATHTHPPSTGTGHFLSDQGAVTASLATTGGGFTQITATGTQSGNHTHPAGTFSVTVANDGSGTADSKMQPFLVVTKIIKT